MIWLVPNNLFWLVSVNHFWLVNGLGPVRSDSGVFVCDRFFAFGNSRLFPERGSLMSDSEMNGARFDMANKDVILSFELRLFWSSLLHCVDKYLWYQRLHSWNVVFAVPWSSCVIGLKWRHQSGVGADSMLTLSLILMTYTEIREHWLTWPVVPSVVTWVLRCDVVYFRRISCTVSSVLQVLRGGLRPPTKSVFSVALRGS